LVHVPTLILLLSLPIECSSIAAPSSPTTVLSTVD
jgi:hypothetical protein